MNISQSQNASLVVTLPFDPLRDTMAPTTILSRQLDEVLHEEKCYETEEGLLKRQSVLQALNVLVKQWIQGVSLSRGISFVDVAKIGGTIVTYGSYKLGISHQGADIDALCLAPQHIQRGECFKNLCNLLSYQKEVTELRAIEEAFVPVLKMRFNGIEIDMTFARLNVAAVPPDDPKFLDNINLAQLDPKCIRSLNGYKSTEMLLKLVPRVDNFRMTLRAIKLWAKRKGLYSNCLGYLGGFSWAVLVAKVCMAFPKYEPAQLVFEFFKMFSRWNWPAPVALTNFEEPPVAQMNGGGHGSHHAWSSWNPEKNASEKHHVMPIITPTFPHQNSTFNVTHSTLALITDKLRKGEATCARIFQGEDTWDELFKTSHIIEEYNHLIVVSAQAKNYIQWFGLIESKIRHFLTTVEKDFKDVIKSARIWPKPFTKKSSDLTSSSDQLWFVGLELVPRDREIKPEELDFKGQVDCFLMTLSTHASKFRAEDDDLRFHASYVHKSDLTAHLTMKEISEIISAQSHKREPSPPPSMLTQVLQPRTSEDAAFGHTSDGGSSSSVNCLSSPSYASAVSKAPMSPASSTTSSTLSSMKNGMNNNYLKGKKCSPPPLFQAMNYPPPPSRNQPLLSQALGPPSHSSRTGLYGSPPSSLTRPMASHFSYMDASYSHVLPHMQGYGYQKQGSVVERAWRSSRTGSTSPTLVSSINGHYSPNLGSDWESVNANGYPEDSRISCGTSDSSNEKARSVSYSSDQFPPPSLVRARIHHSDNKVSSPGSNYDVLPYDTSIPPPRSSGNRQNRHSQRLSSGELRDATTPLPSSSLMTVPHFDFNFHPSAALQHCMSHQSDAVFH